MIVAMHAPDGFLEPSVALLTGLLSLSILAVAVRMSHDELGDRQVPLAGVAAAFIFAAQMVNFPVAAGTSGHLLGGALAAILLGPWVGVLVVTVVVVVQALVFADGGLTALGYNVLNMAIVPTFGGWAVFHWCRRILPANASGVVGASGVAAGTTVVLSAIAFSLEWLFGASAPVAFDTVFGAMVGVHVFIGIGEALITALVVSTVLATRPDLVAGAADLTPEARSTRPAIGRRPFVVGAVLASLFVAVVVSQFASGEPDGLERVATDEGFAQSAEEHGLADSAFADYATRGIDNEQLSLAVAGASGVTLTLVVGHGLASSRRRLRPGTQPAP